MENMRSIKKRVENIKIESLALYFCCRDSRVPVLAKIPAIAAVGLFFSPVDLIPDFIPVLGHLDDIIIIPLLIKLAVRLVPRPILEENRKKAEAMINSKPPAMRAAAAFIIAAWIAVTVMVLFKLFR